MKTSTCSHTSWGDEMTGDGFVCLSVCVLAQTDRLITTLCSTRMNITQLSVRLNGVINCYVHCCCWHVVENRKSLQPFTVGKQQKLSFTDYCTDEKSTESMWHWQFKTGALISMNGKYCCFYKKQSNKTLRDICLGIVCFCFRKETMDRQRATEFWLNKRAVYSRQNSMCFAKQSRAGAFNFFQANDP